MGPNFDKLFLFEGLQYPRSSRSCSTFPHSPQPRRCWHSRCVTWRATPSPPPPARAAGRGTSRTTWTLSLRPSTCTPSRPAGENTIWLVGFMKTAPFSTLFRESWCAGLPEILHVVRNFSIFSWDRGLQQRYWVTVGPIWQPAVKSPS